MKVSVFFFILLSAMMVASEDLYSITAHQYVSIGEIYGGGYVCFDYFVHSTDKFESIIISFSEMRVAQTSWMGWYKTPTGGTYSYKVNVCDDFTGFEFPLNVMVINSNTHTISISVDFAQNYSRSVDSRLREITANQEMLEIGQTSIITKQYLIIENQQTIIDNQQTIVDNQVALRDQHNIMAKGLAELYVNLTILFAEELGYELIYINKTHQTLSAKLDDLKTSQVTDGVKMEEISTSESKNKKDIEMLYTLNIAMLIIVIAILALTLPNSIYFCCLMQMKKNRPEEYDDSELMLSPRA